MLVNTSDYELILAREAALGPFGALDAKRPRAWQQYGYKDELTFDDYFRAYSRGGAGFGAVHRLLDKCWQVKPRIKKPGDDEPGDWEKKVTKSLDDIQAWQKLADFDRRNMIGRFAGLIYRVGDGRALDQPLVRGQRLVDIVPVYENQLRVSRWNEDPAKEEFGTPAMWEYRFLAPHQRDAQAQPDKWVQVHPSRVQILAEGTVGHDFFDGVPLLKAGFNALVDIEKLSGGGGESALKNSARTITFEYEATATPQAITTNPDGTASGKTVKEIHEEAARKINRDLDSTIVLQGGKANTLDTTVQDLEPQFRISANLFAASVQLPFTVLFGQQTGRLASDEDRAEVLARADSRQSKVLTPMLRQLIERLQKAGLVEAGEFEIEWPDLDAPGDSAKYDNLGKLTKAMSDASAAGLTEPIFDANELRKVAGFEERTDDGMPDEADEEAALEAERQHQIALRQATPAAAPAAPRVVASR
jgi:uncharacterized protein